MERLLCIANKMSAAGAETFLMKLYRNVDRSKYQFDFCVSEDGKGFYDKEISNMGGKIFHIVGKSRNPIGAMKELYSVVKKGKYKYVLRFGQHSVTVIDLIVAKIAGAKRTIYRAANSEMTNKTLFNQVLFYLFHPLCKFVPDVKIAPSDLSAEFMFGKNSIEKGQVVLLKNGIPLDDYKFNEEGRNTIRNELKIEDEFLLGHIGRFAKQKNHKKIIEIFYSILEYHPQAHLLLIGTGELENEIKCELVEFGIADKVHFLGERKDIGSLLSAMDAFVFPSFFEGMPNAVIEAQANGLPCVISDTITHSAKLMDNVCMLSLQDPAKVWAKTIVENCHRELPDFAIEALRENGYDIKDVAENFMNLVFQESSK